MLMLYLIFEIILSPSLQNASGHKIIGFFIILFLQYKYKLFLIPPVTLKVILKKIY